MKRLLILWDLLWEKNVWDNKNEDVYNIRCEFECLLLI